MKKVKWGIAGLGNIAQRFATALTQYSQHGELHAVAARDFERAKSFGERFGANEHYGSYQEMAEDSELEAVYIATVHPYHKALAELFLSHQKHVLVEKPAFTNLSDWLEMKALAKHQGVLLLEAMKTVTFPAYQELKAYIKQHQLQLMSIEAGFGNRNPYDPEVFIFNDKLSGGSTLDVGVYSLWLYYDLCHFMNVEVSKPFVEMLGTLDQCHVDTDAFFIFDGAIKGNISSSITTALSRVAILKGNDFTITIKDKWWNPQVIEIEHKGKVTMIESLAAGNGFEFEIDHFSWLVSHKEMESDMLLHQVTERVLTTMEEALKDNGFSHLTG
ncbi:Gfo/Idh/MocA family oxidoreductase [Vibrio tubiashii]|uniref:Gfo/Idh/MocA family protein n=1 Tax=Vibrio tubiashii TaxID=29498 RepID=UPI001EFC8C9F|nr:Gfo/Idh/MocA family oxidoreductase [Vibrio tubiashii]MCG9575801.1 Gfo/Idh/MocA family oxidoreductase [Vibrio tubiashii]